MLQALEAITFTAQRIHMGLTALAGTVFTAERDALPLAPLFPAGLPTVAVDKAAVNASFGFTFPAHSDLDVIHPDKLYVCLFAPGAEVPTDPAEIIAKSVAFGSTDLFPAGIAEGEHGESVATVTVPTLALFPARVNSIEGVIAVPVISHPDAA